MTLPRTLEECFVFLQQRIPPSQLLLFKEAQEVYHQFLINDQVCHMYSLEPSFHHTLGRDLRNECGLWRDSELKQYFNQLGIHHPDDISSIILTSFHRHLHQRPLDLPAQIQSYQDYWSKSL